MNMTLAEFIESRRACEDLRQIPDSPYGSNNSEPDSYPDPISGFVYADQYSIQQHAQDNGFTCFIQFEESSPDLRSLELELFYHYGRFVDSAKPLDQSKPFNPYAGELTLFDRVEMACLQSDIHRALRYVQDGIGVLSGDVAAMHFSDIQDEDWTPMTRLERLERLRRYIGVEIGGETSWRLTADEAKSATAALDALDGEGKQA
jgi:hypothetical protein